MTRKDYIAIAEALRLAREHETEAYLRTVQQSKLGVIGVTTAAEFIANALRDDNPRFDREHFLAVARGEKDLNSRPERKVT